jgi:Uma2 family endonuclease
LESGDRYSRCEFERRYSARPDIKKSELIEGVVYVASPVRHSQHGVPHAMIVTWIGHYVAATPGLSFADNATVRLDELNEPQPDAILTLPSYAGGSGKIDSDGYFHGPPELAVEVSASSASYDLHDKKRAFERNRVREYAVLVTEEKRVFWFRLENDIFVDQPAQDGVFRSGLFPGLWLDAAALLANDLPRLLATLNQGLTTPEHRVFVEQLAATAPGSGSGG